MPSNAIACGQIKTGTRSSQEEVEYIFTATNDYDQVYLEGCESTHDIWLEIKNSDGITIADEDDQFDHFDSHSRQQQCGNFFAGDITIPDPVSIGQTFTFIVKGYTNSAGLYSVMLFCEASQPSVPPTPGPTFGDCVRYREAWHLASQQTRHLYINGFRQLARDGIISAFTGKVK